MGVKLNLSWTVKNEVILFPKALHLRLLVSLRHALMEAKTLVTHSRIISFSDLAAPFGGDSVH